MDPSLNKLLVAFTNEVPYENLKSLAISKDDPQDLSNTLQPFLTKALSSPSNIGEIPASLFPPVSDSDHLPRNSQISWPILKAKSRNNILLYTGSFNPPHQGHLATVLYFYEHREQLGVTAMFVFADPSSIINDRKKAWGDIVLPQELRCELFYRVPEIFELVESGWLHLLVGDMDNHINVLRTTTDLISEAGFDVKLVGVLGGDKITIKIAPQYPPGNLSAWGLVDEFLTMNARRPVDFFDPEKEEVPRKLPDCTEWEKCTEEGDKMAERLNKDAGVLWECRAFKASGSQIIKFRASQSSASNGVSSTKIRQIMTEAPDEELMEGLKDKVISVESLVEWLQLQRKQKRETTG
ncbi:hypothetical protein NHQ30_004275 [Ciborinia camelliae]|nr:hypothetical protein NHQ30_004275 [Ciborinia camelliae]